MNLRFLALVPLVVLPLAATASGYRPPAHSQLTYSFTCPSGTSGHITYTKDFVSEARSHLRIWVNGNYVHEVPGVAEALKVRNIEQVQASCGGDETLVIVETFDPPRGKDKKLQVVVIRVDSDGNVSSVDG